MYSNKDFNRACQRKEANNNILNTSHSEINELYTRVLTYIYILLDLQKHGIKLRLFYVIAEYNLITNFTMEKEENEPEQILATLSQVTTYIRQWQTRKHKNAQNNLIVEEYKDTEEIQLPFSRTKQSKQQRKTRFNREVSQQNDLKKCKKKIQAIKKIEFPIIDNILIPFEEQFILPTYKIKEKQQTNSNKNIPRKKQSINNKIMQTIQDQQILKKIDQFQRKLQASKKSIVSQDSTPKMTKYVPRVLLSKKTISLDKVYPQKIKMPAIQSVQQFKKELDKNKRKFSLPNFPQY